MSEDILPKNPQKYDRLDELWERTEQLRATIFEKHDLNFESETWLMFNLLAIEAELGELINESGFEWWAHRDSMNEDAFREELVDVMHFVLETANIVFEGPEDFYQEFIEKNDENFRRQQKGYEK